MRNEPFIGVMIFGTESTFPFTATAMDGEAGFVVALSILGVPVALSSTSSVGTVVDGAAPPTVSITMSDRATPEMSAFVMIGGVTRWIVAPDVGSVAVLVFGPALVEVAKISIVDRGATNTGGAGCG